MLEIRLLGQFAVSWDGASISIPSRPAQSLFAFLALHPGIAHRRERLAGILWPDSAEANARANLRAALWRARKSLAEGARQAGQALTADNIAVTFQPPPAYWLDAAALERKLAAAPSLEELMETASVYQGELLPGFYDEWLLPERERLRAIAEQRYAQLAAGLLAERRWAEALEWGERWIALGSAPEAAYQCLMDAHAALGDAAAAQATYQRAATALQRELGIEPSAEMRAVLERLQASAPPAPETALPVPITPLVGREAELSRLAELLADPACRLLTLVGIGGTGKTRLALEFARTQQRAFTFADGVHFAALAPLQSAAFLPSAVVGALGLTLYGAQDPKQQLTAFLRDRRLLLVLDNFDHLLPGAPLLADLLAAAPGLNLLVTSRERLNLQAEYVFEVGGLAFPPAGDTAAVEKYGAVALFLQTAQRVNRALAVAEETAPAIAHICRLVVGVPLAVELAAQWVRHMPVEEIASEIERSLDLLTTSLRDVPERHRSLRAVFDYSWALLSEEERVALRRLSVFRGGFEREAADTVAGARLSSLAALVDKSLLRRTAAGRYELPELLRQYALGVLEQSGEAEGVRRRLCDYVLAEALQAGARLTSPDEAEATRRLEADHDNARAALAWCLETGEAEAALRLAVALADFWWRRGYILEGSDWLTRALALEAAIAPDLRSLALLKAALLVGEGGHMPGAMLMAEEALTLARQAADRHVIALAQARLASGYHFSGDGQRAIALLEESIREFRDLDDPLSVRTYLLVLADAYMRAGDLARGAELWEECLALFRKAGDAWGIAFALGGSGDIAMRQGHFAKAAALFNEALTIQEARGHRVDLAYNLEAQAILATKLGQPRRAARLWGAAEALREAIDTPVPRGYRLAYEVHWAEGRAEAGDVAFAAAWVEGRQRTVAEAVAYAKASGE